jgi:SAM-dependent methyltransferase
MSELGFSAWQSYWIKRATAHGDAYVGRLGQDPALQTTKISSILASLFPPRIQYSDVLDFGCGYGRFIPFLADHAEHVWAVDIVPAALAKARQMAKNVSALELRWPVRFPWRGAYIDCLWACSVLQYIVDASVYRSTVNELARILKPGARVLLLDNAVDRAKHVCSRDPKVLAADLKLRTGWTAKRVTVDARPMDHWLLDGVRG